MSTQEPLRPMHLSLRFIAPLKVALALLAYLLVPLVDKLALRWWINDLDTRSELVANPLQDERLYSLAFCDDKGKLCYSTPTYPVTLGCRPPASAAGEAHSVIRLRQGPLHVVQRPL